jgi:hypothetical protein
VLFEARIPNLSIRSPRAPRWRVAGFSRSLLDLGLLPVRSSRSSRVAVSAGALFTCRLTCLRAWPLLQSSLPVPGVIPSSRGVRPPRSLPADVHPRVHSRTRRPFGRSVPDDRSRSVFAVSHRPDGLLLVDGAGLLHPAAGRRVRRVSRCCAGPIRGPVRTLAFPATPFHTPRRTPLVSSRAASPRPLPSCRHHPLRPLPSRVLVCRPPR